MAMDTMHIVYQDFFQFVYQFAPDFDVNQILPQLIITGVINAYDRAMIESQNTALERSLVLLLTIMPAKTSESHQNLVKILKMNNYNGLARRLAANLKSLESCNLRQRVRDRPSMQADTDANAGGVDAVPPSENIPDAKMPSGKAREHSQCDLVKKAALLGAICFLCGWLLGLYCAK